MPRVTATNLATDTYILAQQLGGPCQILHVMVERLRVQSPDVYAAVEKAWQDTAAASMVESALRAEPTPIEVTRHSPEVAELIEIVQDWARRCSFASDATLLGSLASTLNGTHVVRASSTTNVLL